MRACLTCAAGSLPANSQCSNKEPGNASAAVEVNGGYAQSHLVPCGHFPFQLALMHLHVSETTALPACDGWPPAITNSLTSERYDQPRSSRKELKHTDLLRGRLQPKWGLPLGLALLNRCSCGLASILLLLALKPGFVHLQTSTELHPQCEKHMKKTSCALQRAMAIGISRLANLHAPKIRPGLPSCAGRHHRDLRVRHQHHSSEHSAGILKGS